MTYHVTLHEFAVLSIAVRYVSLLNDFDKQVACGIVVHVCIYKKSHSSQMMKSGLLSH